MSSLPRKMLLVSGFLNLVFALFHMAFWWVFDWQVELTKITAENGSIMQVLNLSLVFILLAAAYLAFFYGPDLIQSRLGRALLVAWSMFWFIRSVNQVVFWGVNAESIALTLFFILVGVINLTPVIKERGHTC